MSHIVAELLIYYVTRLCSVTVFSLLMIFVAKNVIFIFLNNNTHILFGKL